MNRKQLVAIAALPTLTLTMIPVFGLLARWLGRKRAWYAGFLVYWPIWCILFPLRIVGPQKLRALLKFQRLQAADWFMLIVFPTLAFLGRYTQDKPRRSAREKAVLVFMTCMNGLGEEVLWRGVYVALFPDSRMWGVVWPTVWFTLWHYAPGSVSPLTDVRVLMTGAGALGVCLSWLSLKTQSIRTAALSHILGGLAQALS
jgi:membrane protease YdiL (CAAX protease family)